MAELSPIRVFQHQLLPCQCRCKPLLFIVKLAEKGKGEEHGLAVSLVKHLICSQGKQRARHEYPPGAGRKGNLGTARIHVRPQNYNCCKNGFVSRSSPMVVGNPCPGNTGISSGKTRSRL